MESKVLSNASIRKGLVIVYLAGLTFPLWHNLALFFGLPHNAEYVAMVFPMWTIGMTICTVGLFFLGWGNQRRLEPTVILLCLAMCWIVVRFFLERELLFVKDPNKVWLRGYAAWFLFFPAGFLLEEKEVKRAVTLLAWIWGAIMLMISGIGILGTIKGVTLHTLGDAEVIGVQEFIGEYRLWLGDYVTSGAENLLIAFVLLAFAFFLTDRKWLRAAYIGAGVIMAVALGLTDGRNGMLSLGMLIGVGVFAALLPKLIHKRVPGVAACFASAGLTLVLCYVLLCQIPNFFPFQGIRDIYLDDVLGISATEDEEVWEEEPEEILTEIPDAEAFEMEEILPEDFFFEDQEEEIYFEDQFEEIPDELSHRKVDPTMMGRTWIWKSCISILQKNTKNALLIGRTPFDVKNVIWEEMGVDWYAHAHNIYLQVFLEWGLPGFLIMVTFLVYFVFAAFRVLFAVQLPYWQRFAPAGAIAMLFAELVDCFSRIATETVSLYVLFLFMGVTIALDRKNRISKIK